MLRPTKHSHPDQTVIHATYLILKKVKASRVVDYEQLFTWICRKIPKGGDLLFVPALNLLFLLGLIEYRAKRDFFEYVGPS